MITNTRVAGSVPLDISNARTAVLFDVLALATCDLAESEWQRKLAYWVLQHDQSRIGLGAVGFDIAVMGSTTEHFEQQHQFVLTVLDAALSKHGWERLPFTPTEEGVFPPPLKRLRELVSTFGREHIRPASETDWTPDELPRNGLCASHRVYLHEFGCIVCNDTPL